MKRILCLCLTLLTIVGLLVSCGEKPEVPSDTTTDSSAVTGSETTTENKPADLVFGQKGEKSDYVVVRPEKCGQRLTDSVVDLFKAICAATGKNGTIKDDWYKNESDIAAHEVVIGATNRPESSAYTGKLGGNDWYITVVGEKIVINGGSEGATASAVKYFMENYVVGKELLAVPGDLDYHYVSDIDMINILDVKDKIKVIGRYSELPNGIACDWTASGIEFTADCEGEVVVGLTSTKSTASSGYDGDSYFTVYVDGVRQDERLEAVSGEESLLTLASGLEKGTHTFRLLKQSHVAHSKTVITSISLKGTIGERPADRKAYIEFYGDSITCGYGVASEYVRRVNGLANNDAYYCDGTKAYAFLAAEELDVDYSMVSVSGWRLAGTSASIPITCYPYINWNRNSQKYDFTSRVPDLVVINLGTNDYSAKIGEATFGADMETWIKRIRSDYGKADLPFVFVVNSMSDGYQGTIKSKLTEMGGEAAGLYVMTTVQDRRGLSNHPTCAGQKKTAELLSKFIRDNGIIG